MTNNHKFSVEVSGETVFGTIANMRQAQGGEFVNVDQHMAGKQVWTTTVHLIKELSH